MSGVGVRAAPPAGDLGSHPYSPASAGAVLAERVGAAPELALPSLSMRFALALVATVLSLAVVPGVAVAGIPTNVPPYVRPRERSTGAARVATARRHRGLRAAVREASRGVQLLHLVERERLGLPLAVVPPRGRACAEHRGDAVGGARGHRPHSTRPRAGTRRRLPGRPEQAARRARPGHLPAPAVGDEQRQQLVRALQPGRLVARPGELGAPVPEGVAAHRADRPRWPGRRDEPQRCAGSACRLSERASRCCSARWWR